MLLFWVFSDLTKRMRVIALPTQGDYAMHDLGTIKRLNAPKPNPADRYRIERDKLAKALRTMIALHEAGATNDAADRDARKVLAGIYGE